MKIYIFRAVRLSIIRSLFTVLAAIVYVIQVCRQLSSRIICSCSKAVYKPVWHIPLLSVQWINFWWWTDELSETCTVSCQNEFVKFVQLFGFIVKKFVTMHGHTNVKFIKILYPGVWFPLRILTNIWWTFSVLFCRFNKRRSVWVWNLVADTEGGT